MFENIENLQLFELVVDAEEDGVFANSFVEEPAMERDFVFFNKQKEIQFQAIDNEKRLVAGPLLIPNKKIIRMDEEMGMYNVFFKPETIEMIARKFMKNKYNGEVTVEHDKKVNDVENFELCWSFCRFLVIFLVLFVIASKSTYLIA